MEQGQRLEQIAKRAAKLAWRYHHEKQELKAKQKQVDKLKDDFEDAMLEYSDSVDKKRLVFEDGEITEGQRLIVNRVEKTSIEWNADKLAKRITKRVARQVIRKQYRINDIQGLIEYLKSCGVDPKVFKTFITVDQTVDAKAIERLGDTGQLSVKAISGCYLVRSQKPYFTTSVKKDDGDGEE